MLKLSSGASVSGLYDTLISSNRANIATKSREALIEESQKPLQSTIKTAPNDSYSASYLGSKHIKIAFEDAKSGQMISTNLSLKNAINLILTFKNENNFFLRNDGVLRLNGEAQNFVSGWFNELAYNLNLLGADADKNGLVEGEENLNAFYYRTPYVYGNAKKAQDTTIYTLAGGERLAFYDTALRGQENGVERTIEAALDGVLSEDENADGKISFLEHFGSLKAALGNVEMDISGSKTSFNPLEFILEELKKMLQEALEGATSLESKALEQGLSALSAIELELFKSQNPLEYERLKNEQKNLKNLIMNEQNLSKNSQENSNLNDIKSQKSAGNLSENLSANFGVNLPTQINNSGANLGLNSSTETSPARQRVLNLLEKSLGRDFLAQIKSYNLKIVDLRA